MQHLGKLCWISGGLTLLLGIILAVLTVELAADPDKWPGRSEAVLAAAARMFRVSSTAGGLGTAEGGAAGGEAGPSRVGGVGVEGEEEGVRAPLLRGQSPGPSEPEIVEA